MDKKKIIAQLIEKFDQEIKTYERIAEQARQDAISSEIKQEGKYDTRAIEAGYLAGAQKRRHDELLIERQALKTFDWTHLQSATISIGSLVLLSDEDTESWYFISPGSGGFDVSVDNQTVKVISAQTPLAKAMIQLDESEVEFSLKLPNGLKEFIVKKKA